LLDEPLCLAKWHPIFAAEPFGGQLQQASRGAHPGENGMNTSRRRFLKTTATAAGGLAAASSLAVWAKGGRYPVGPGSAKVAIVPEMSHFNYSQVQLLEGPFRRQFEQQHDLFLHLNEDAMLKPFRNREGMDAPGPDMGGWYDDANDFNTSDNFHS